MLDRTATVADLFAWPGTGVPDYVSIFAWRQQQLLSIRSDRNLLISALEYYRDPEHAAQFITHWCDTYDPRLAGTDMPTRVPFVLFARQLELVEFLVACLTAEENGLIEKCRDMGATWVCGAFSVWLWLFWPGASAGWGSRKEQLVDRIGDADSIFEKMRMLVQGLPREFLPRGLRPVDHLTYMRLVNPQNGATITGESGDNIGRGGRKLIYFKDESAHYEHPEKIEAALTDNTRCQIDISSVNGLGNVFHRRREAGFDWSRKAKIPKGKTRVFVMDWRDHPQKTIEWYNQRRQKHADDGLLHVFAQEVDRDYSSAVQGTILPLEWVRAAIDAHLRIPGLEDGAWVAALDVADGGDRKKGSATRDGDRNALVKRKGVVLRHCEEWGERDTGATARRAVDGCKGTVPIELQYDCIGVGSGVKAETNRLVDEGLMPRGVRLVPWDAGSGVLRPDDRVIPGDSDSPLNKDFYANLKAQGWWDLRRRFERTYRALTEKGVRYNADDLISLDSKMPALLLLIKQLCQPVMGRSTRLRLLVDKMPEGMRSPNMADGVMMCYFPANAMSYDVTLAWVGGPTAEAVR